MSRKKSLADSIRARSLALQEKQQSERREKQRKRPYLFVGPSDDILFVENVAEMLGCGKDYVRRIPRRELPASRCGARIQYLREDVVAYVRRNRDEGKGDKVDLHVSKSCQEASIGPADYDPVAESRRQLGGKPKR